MTHMQEQDYIEKNTFYIDIIQSENSSGAISYLN